MEPPPLRSNTMEPSLPFSSSPSLGRRLPPPCWSHEETVALIDSYRDKWYSLRRGNLRAVHWQDVADAVGGLCPHSSPAKTSVQCRHKMEKLRKRYRSELQRALSIPNYRFSSAWVYFKKMDHMEKGTDDVPMENDDVNGNDGYQFSVNDLKRSYCDVDFHGSVSNGSSFAPSKCRSKNYGKYEESQNPSFNYKTRTIRGERGSGSRYSSMSKLGKQLNQGEEANGLVPAIKMLGEGFVKMEKMKMDMMRQIEQTRMEMEMKRTEMILESQQVLVDALVKGISESVKNAKGRSPQKS